MTEVRSAMPEDRAGLLVLCQALHEENGQHAVCWPKVTAMVDRGLAQHNAIFGVIGPVGEPVGAVLLLLDPVWYSEEWQLLELFNFVHRDHRATDYAKSLIAYAKDCATALGIDLTIGVMSNEHMASKLRLYRRMLPEAGGFFCFRPPEMLAAGDEMAVAAE